MTIKKVCSICGIRPAIKTVGYLNLCSKCLSERKDKVV